MITRCVVAGNTPLGPDLYSVKVDCSPAQRKEGLHYEAAKDHAEVCGMERPMVAFDEDDHPGPALIAMFKDWAKEIPVKA